MKKLILLILLCSCYAGVSAQDLQIENNLYDQASDYNKGRNAFKRERWFYEQRMFPNNSIPVDAYANAVAQRDQMRQQNGFYGDNINNWVSLGPSPGFISSFSHISSRITTIKYDPVNPNIIYLGAAYGGVWKSTNGGLNWSPKTDNEVSLSSGSLAIDPTNTNIIYYATGEATYSAASYYGRGILKSIDAGNTWVNYTTGLPNQTFSSRLVIRPNHPTELFLAGGVNGLYKSTNSGVSWTQLVSGRCDDVIFTASGDTSYIVGSGTGYRISTDGGNVYTVNGAVGMLTRNHIAICKAAPNVLYISKHNSSGVTVHKSTDKGATFTQVAGSVSGGAQAWYDFYMHVNPTDPNIAYVGLINIFRTTDGGASFQNISGSGVHPDQHNMDFHPTNANELLAVNDGGVLKSTNSGTTWINLNESLTLTQFYRIASDPSNADHILGGTQDNGTQRTTGTLNWTESFGGDGGEVCFHPQNNQLILGETQNNGIKRSTDGGNTWTNAVTGLTGTGVWVGPIIAHPDSAGVFYTARGQVFKTTNTGASWTGISTGSAGTIKEMAISESSPNVLYLTTGTTVYRSSDRGYSFANITSGMPGRIITSISVHPDSANVAIVTFSGFGPGKIYKTTNAGTNWINVSGNLPDSPANDGLIYYPGVATKVLLVAMDVGVFLSNNDGATWIELADGLPNTVAMHLDYHLASNKLRIGTHGRGVYEIVSLTGVASYTNESPTEFKILQNYPNPFNPSTTITYKVPVKGMISIKVYDMIGKEVATLVNQIQSIGSYDVVFNASSLTSGVYFYRLESGSFTETKKLMLIK